MSLHMACVGVCSACRYEGMITRPSNTSFCFFLPVRFLTKARPSTADGSNDTFRNLFCYRPIPVSTEAACSQQDDEEIASQQGDARIILTPHAGLRVSRTGFQGCGWTFAEMAH